MAEVDTAAIIAICSVSIHVRRLRPSPKDGQTVFGYVEPYGIIHGNQCTWLQTPFGVPVADAYARAIELAGRTGVSALWIDDPKGLFPAVDRLQ